MPVYFATLRHLLKLAGQFLNHGVPHFAESWKKTLFTDYINRYVFLQGQLAHVGIVQSAMEHAEFEIADVESFRPHYALTRRQSSATRTETRTRIAACQRIDVSHH